MTSRAIPEGYEHLDRVLMDAFQQAASGKGKERHALDAEPFEKQKICEIGRKHVVNVSGGKDSTAMYLLAMEWLNGDFLPVFADTGNEHEITLEYVSRLAERTRGPAIQIVRADFKERICNRTHFIAKNYEQEKALEALEALEAWQADLSPFFACCLWKGMFPSSKIRFCTTELKIIPIQRYVYTPLLDAGDAVLSWQGIRAEESKGRSKMPEIDPLGDGVAAYRPLLHWTVQDVFDMHSRHGIDPNPLYKMGMGRVGCMPCLMARKSEIAQIARRFPDHIEKIRQWEYWVQSVAKKVVGTFFPCTKVPGTSDMRSSIDNVVAWATSTTPGQRHLPYERTIPTCQSEYGLCE